MNQILEDLLPEDLDGPLRALAEELGVELALQLVDYVGGENISIPDGHFAPTHKVVRAIGSDAAERLRTLCHEAALVSPYIPTRHTLRYAIAHRRIQSSGDMKPSELARELGVSKRMIYKARKSQA